MIQPAVEIPARLAGRPRDERGLVIPFAQARTPRPGQEPAPDFAHLDEPVRRLCMADRLCGLCGEKLDWWIWFIGGTASVESRLFMDPPSHEECARYALAVCPFLAGDRAVGLYQTRRYSVVIVKKDDKVRSPGVYMMRAAPAKKIEWKP